MKSTSPLVQYGWFVPQRYQGLKYATSMAAYPKTLINILINKNGDEPPTWNIYLPIIWPSPFLGAKKASAIPEPNSSIRLWIRCITQVFGFFRGAVSPRHITNGKPSLEEIPRGILFDFPLGSSDWGSPMFLNPPYAPCSAWSKALGKPDLDCLAMSSL